MIETRTVRAVSRGLARRYGEPQWDGPGDPVGGLIATILSQSTTYLNYGPAFESLLARFPTWDALADAPVGEIADAIRSGGLADQKAARIKAILLQLRAERGAVTLDFLAALAPAEATRVLTAFKGVGPKTAACVLMFDLGMQVFPVDTHVFRISGRLGWLPEKATPESAHAHLEPLIPPELRYPLHVNLIAHGRGVCRPQRPGCDQCPIRGWCGYVAVSL